MNSLVFRKSFLLLLLAVCFWAKAAAPTGSAFEGNALTEFVGKDITSQEIKDLLAGYKFEMANNDHYTSKDGIELVFKAGKLDEIHLYKDHFTNGSFKGELPRNLKFGLSTTEVKQVLGTPKLWYNNGYGEFQFGNYLISCWFEENMLNQIVIAPKGT